MTNYECWSLALTAIYDLLTFCLLVVVAYEALVKPNLANLSIFFRTMPEDTKEANRLWQPCDFVIDNRGPEIKNITISSNPDFIGWGNVGESGNAKPKTTSSFF